MNKNLVPNINGKFEEKSAAFRFPAHFNVSGGAAEVWKVFEERLQRLGDYALDEAAAVTVEAIENPELAEEGYRLSIAEDGVKIESKSRQGLILALATLYQLLSAGGSELSCCDIEDSPRFGYRGIMLDVCRHFFPVEEVRRVIEQGSLVKMNAFHWHLSDDQGFRIESKRFPKLNEVGSRRKLARLDPMVTCGKAQPREVYGGCYTQEEIRDVVAFAAARGIEVIPEIDLPGHASAILAAYPEYTCSGEPLEVKNTFGVHERIFCAGNEQAYAFLEQLLEEVAELFPGKHFHIGGDEAPKTVWKECPCCRKVYEEKKLKNWEQLQTVFMNRVIEILKKLGKTPIVWNDSAATGELAPEAVVQYWAEMAPGESYMVSDAANGRRIIFSNADQFYCTDSYASLPLRSTLTFEPNVKGNPVSAANEHGIETAMWTEWCPTEADIEKQIYPRLLAVAECAWCKEKDVDEFTARAHEFLSLPGLNILNGEDWDKVTISGDAALQEIAMSMLMLGARYRALSDAEAEDGGQAGQIGAVTPDQDGDGVKNPMENASPEMIFQMVRSHVAGKMAASYGDAEIDKVTGMILKMKSNRR